MKHFSINSDNNITVHASRKAAKETGLPVFSTEAQLTDLIASDSKRLLAIHNSLPGVKAVTKLSNRKTACEKIWKTIQGLAGPTAAQPAPEFRSCVEAVEALSASEAKPESPATPFDGPGPAAHIEGPPAAAAAGEELATGSAEVPDVAPERATATKKTARAKKAPIAPKEAKPAKSEGAREGSKMAQVIAMLKRENGATLEEIMEKMAWQRHTVRGFMAGAMKKAGYTVESFKSESGDRTYRINAAGR